MSNPCECINPNFKKMELKHEKKKRIEKINRMLDDKFFKMMIRID